MWGEIIIRALSDGKVDSLSVTVGQMVNAGDSLLQVIPENIENYYLILWVPNDAVPYISAGDKVNIRYEAFPAEKFGQFSATVKTISRTPASTQEMLTYKGRLKIRWAPLFPGIRSSLNLKIRLFLMTGNLSLLRME